MPKRKPSDGAGNCLEAGARTRLQPSTFLLRLVYFDFKFFMVALPIAKQLSLLAPIPFDVASMTARLQKIKKAYETFKDESPEIISTRESTLEAMLAQTYQARLKIWDYIQFCFGLKKLLSNVQGNAVTILCEFIERINPLLSGIDSQLDQIIRITNARGEPTDVERQHFEQNLHYSKITIDEILAKLQFDINEVRQIELCKIIQTHLLKLSLHDLYPDVFQRMAKILLLEKWLDEVAKIALHLGRPNGAGNKTLKDILQIKHLFSEVKLQFFTQYYHQLTHHKPLIEKKICQWIFAHRQLRADIIINQLMVRLDETERQLRSDVNRLEVQCQAYTRQQDFTTGCFRLWTENYYYLFAKNVFSLVGKLTAAGAFQHYPILNTQLEEQYQDFFTFLSSGMLLSMDTYLYGQLGVAYVMLSTFSQFLLSNYLLPLTQLLHLDEGTMIAQRSKLKWLMGLILHVTVFLGLSEVSIGATGLLSLSYMLGTTLRELSGQAMNWGERRIDGRIDPLAVETRGLLIRPVVNQLAYMGGYRLGGTIFRSTAAFFAPQPEAISLLSDANLCREHPKECEAAVLTTLEISPTAIAGTSAKATTKEIRDAWKRLILKYHPDKTRDDSAMALDQTIQINQAYTRLGELRRSFR